MGVNAASPTSGSGRTVVCRMLEEQTRFGRIGDHGPTENSAAARSGATTITPTGDSTHSNEQHGSAEENDKAAEDFGDLSPFIFVPRIGRPKDDHLARYDPEIDIPRPHTHAEVVRHRVAKSAAGRRRAELQLSEVSE